MTVFGNRVLADAVSYDEVIKVALIQYDWCPYKKGRFGHRPAHRESALSTRMQNRVVSLQAKEQGPTADTRSPGERGPACFPTARKNQPSVLEDLKPPRWRTSLQLP